MESILDTGKDGYSADDEFDRRTEAAVKRRPSEWGDGDDLYHRDAVEVLEFVQGDYQTVASILAGLEYYRIVDLGCGYGRLAPLLWAFDCRSYLGIDRCRARVVHADRICRPIGGRFLRADILDRKTWSYHRHHDYDVVWTSCVLQHLTIPDKLRLVETMKACRAPGGICILREEEVLDLDRQACEERYAAAGHSKHMIPIPFDELAEAFLPLKLERLPKVGDSPHRVYVAREES